MIKLWYRVRIWWLERGNIAPERCDTQQTREANRLRSLLRDR